MLRDHKLRFTATSQVFTADDQKTDIVDLDSVRNLAPGEPLAVFFKPVADGTGAGNLLFQLWCSDATTDPTVIGLGRHLGSTGRKHYLGTEWLNSEHDIIYALPVQRYLQVKSVSISGSFSVDIEIFIGRPGDLGSKQG